ncbi:MAG TPA: PLP-dependent aminotransferase family protein [Herpetosiphonaceae bacterium]|nr:PLP-dependent aminotransferase family protein [Herpetosiphonaceae bacterium]
MLIPINPQTARPIYLQIADHIGALARSGQIGPGERLPSSRHLAEQLQVHRSTVVNAYDELRARGVIDAVHGSGSYIAAGLVDSAAAAPDATALATPDALDRERLIAQIWRLNQAAGMISLALAIPAAETLPLAALERARQRAIRREGGALHGYIEPQGYAPLRRAIAHDLARHGIQAGPDDVVVTCGAQEALALAAHALAVPGDAALIESPAFFGTWLGLQRAGFRLLPFAVGGRGLDWPDLGAAYRGAPAHPRFAVVSPDFQNPTGLQWDAAERHRFLGWAAEQGVVVIEDATYRDLRIDGHPLVPLRALDPGVIYVGSFSKSLMPGLRIGFILAGGPLRDQLVTLKTITSGSNESASQIALADYLGSGEYANHLEDAAGLYRRRRDALLAALAAEFPADARWTRPSGGFYVWVELPPRQPVAALFGRALAEGIVIAPAAMFVAGGAAPNAFRICFARYDEAVLAHAVATLGRLLR